MKKSFLTIFFVMMIAFTGCSESTLAGNENQSTEEPEMAQNQEENNTKDITEETNSEETSEEKPESEERKVYKGRTYIFYKADPDKLPEGTHNIRGIYNESSYSAKHHSLFIGQLLTLFEDPDYVTDNNEDLLSYVVAAEDTNGNVIYMEVYYGPSGPAIGGLEGEDYELAAKELERIIKATQATDFEIESVYEDYGVTLKMGVKNGIAYYDTIFPEGTFDEYE